MLRIKQAMVVDEEFRKWFEQKVAEKPSRIHERWFREMAVEWAEAILRNSK